MLVGNIDLLGVEVLEPLLHQGVPVLHHIGFINPPFHPTQQPTHPSYQLVGASKAVSQALVQAGLGQHSQHSCKSDIPVVYPGVRSDLFGDAATRRRLPPPLDGSSENQPIGTQQRPLLVCFAGLLMGKRGPYPQALVLLKQRGIFVEGHLAGGSFNVAIESDLKNC